MSATTSLTAIKRRSRFTLFSIMYHVVLVHPEIPPNTGNIIRLCANTGSKLHLIKPLGFSVDDKHLVRAGLDYHEMTTLTVYENWDDFLARENPDRTRMFAMTTKGSSVFSTMHFQNGDWLVFGSEGKGLPDAVRDFFPASQRIRLPMFPDNRSLNLSNAVAVVCDKSASDLHNHAVRIFKHGFRHSRPHRGFSLMSISS